MYKHILTLGEIILVLVFAGCSDTSQITSPENPTTLEKSGAPGVVYTMTNATDGNEVVVFRRHRTGLLTAGGSFPTGGNGTGAGLGNQGGLILAKGGRLVLVCNAGSDEISVLTARGADLQLLKTVDSGGEMPISVTAHGNIVYVLNAGGSGNITGFRLRGSGNLTQIASQPLSGSGTGPAQVGFSPNGRVLIVTEKGTNLLVTYVVDGNGVAQAPQTFPSSGMTPFGFAFDRSGHLIVSEAFGGAANASAVSSYAVDNQGNLQVISPSVASNQSAACWIAITNSGKYAYSTNTGSGNVSGYRISAAGSLGLLNSTGISGVTGNGTRPIDMAFSRNSKFLYTLNSGTSDIEIFRVLSNGGLVNLGSIGGLPSGANGLAAR